MVGARFVMAKIVYYPIKKGHVAAYIYCGEVKIHLESCMGF
jgi:hypothetical protein